MNEIPLGLKHALEAGECVLFVGSGIGAYLKKTDGTVAPDGESLAKELIAHFSIETKDNYDLAQISKIVELRKGCPELIAFLSKRFSDLQPDLTLQWLSTIRWRAIFTTNYDNGIQRAYELAKKPAQNFKTISATSDIVHLDSRFDVPIYHLHGALFQPESPRIIITEDDYSFFQEKRRMLFALLKQQFITSTFLYIGYSNRDPNWKKMLIEITAEFYPSSMPISYRVAPDTNQIEREILLSKNINSLDMDLEEFVAIASSVLSVTDEDRDRINKIRSKIPSDLSEAFEKNPVPVVRLLSSWAYVNQVPYSEKSNIKSFLLGDRPNWALIGAKHYFERDIEEEVYEDLLDYATSTTSTANVRILLASAGYGVSTTLMSLAVKLIKEKAGPVFMLKPGCNLLEGDVEFAAGMLPKRAFFFVDNAADHVENLRNVIQRFRETKTAGLFLLGERLNEWRQKIGSLRDKEFLIDPLSDAEINKLIDFLGEHSALNKLEYLSRELQFSAIKKNYNKELLVAMREATEGKDFDAILVDEFRGIGDNISRLAYLTVCCFYQHGTYIRDTLLSELVEKNLVEFYELTSKSTDGVIFYDNIDESRYINGARARHRSIASVVWERCGTNEVKERIVRKAMEMLNLNFPTDAKAFETFYRSDRIVDSITKLSEKIQFFEKACKKDPESPYIRQHYARMLLREHNLELALSKINAAIDLDNKARVLYHTKGLILSEMAFETESLDIARKRFIQSEACFKKCINMAPRDHFGYQGLSQLYLGWAMKSPSEDEKSQYVEEAEDIIDKGLREVRVRDGLWIESANIQRFLGDNPEYLKALEKAVYAAPESVIARYLLGRAYRKSGILNKAEEVLRPVIVNHHDEFRSFVEYAIILHYMGKSWKECIAVLEQSTLYGYSDPRFISTLGGMHFMDGNFSQAEKTFEESYKRNFTVIELNTIQFRPVDNLNQNQLYRIKGRVINVKAGHAWIGAPGYPKSFFCPGSKFRGVLMEQGLDLSFEMAFNAKGPIADNPQTAKKLGSG